VGAGEKGGSRAGGIAFGGLTPGWAPGVVWPPCGMKNQPLWNVPVSVSSMLLSRTTWVPAGSFSLAGSIM
jgi:hypothetical protein